MNRLNQVINDKVIIEIYNKIEVFENIDKGLAHHNMQHVMNVAELMDKILTKLNYDEDFIEEAKISAILHDVGAIEGKDNHALRSYKFAQTYLKEKVIVLRNKDLVLDAIKIHSDGFDSQNIIALTLILSDKLDIKYTRLAKEGYNVKGIRELQYIKEILVDIDNKELIIRFICDDKINRKDLEGFYFISKVFSSISAFSNRMDLIPRVSLGNEEWKLFKDQYK